MLTIREEVQAFVRATEMLQSPIMLGKALNEDERDMVAMCAQSLAQKFPVRLLDLNPRSKLPSPPQLTTLADFNTIHQVPSLEHQIFVGCDRRYV